MRLRSVLPLLFLVTLPLTARAQRVIFGNVERLRQPSATRVHTAGAERVIAHLRGRGATVRRVRVDDLRPGPRMRLDLARLGPADVFALSATMTTSLTKVRELVRDLKKQGVAPQRIVVGGRAVTRALANDLGVRFAIRLGTRFDAFLSRSRSRGTSGPSARSTRAAE